MNEDIQPIHIQAAMQGFSHWLNTHLSQPPGHINLDLIQQLAGQILALNAKLAEKVAEANKDAA